MTTTTNSSDIADAIKLLELGEYSECKFICKNILNSTPNNFQANYILGYSAYMQKQYGVAKKYLKKSIEIDPENSDALNTLACVLKNLGEELAAETTLAKSLQYNRDNPNAYINLAMIKIDQKLFDNARDYLFKAMELQPENDKVYIGLAIVHREQHLLDLALQYIDIAIALKPDSEKAFTEKSRIIRQSNTQIKAG